jgi:outer membrane protein TolC
VETRVGPQENRLFVAQRIPWLGKLRDQGAAAQREAEAAEMDYHQVRHRVRMEVAQGYYDLRWLDMALTLLHEELEILSHMEEAARVKYSTGEAGQQDVLKVQVERANIQRRILEMQQGAVSARARLAQLLDTDPAASLGSVGNDPPRRDPLPLEVLLELGRANRPDLGASALRLRSSEEMLDLARKAYLPDLTLRLDYIQVGNPEMPGVRDGGKDAVSIGASVNLPLWLGKKRAGVREAEARAAAGRSQLRGARTETEARIHDALAKVRASLETARLYETSILPQAEQAFFAAQAAYQTGSADFLTYLDSERVLLNLRVAYHRALSDLGSHYARLEWAVGLPLDEILVKSGE